MKMTLAARVRAAGVEQDDAVGVESGSSEVQEAGDHTKAESRAVEVGEAEVSETESRTAEVEAAEPMEAESRDSGVGEAEPAETEAKSRAAVEGEINAGGEADGYGGAKEGGAKEDEARAAPEEEDAKTRNRRSIKSRESALSGSAPGKASGFLSAKLLLGSQYVTKDQASFSAHR